VSSLKGSGKSEIRNSKCEIRNAKTRKEVSRITENAQFAIRNSYFRISHFPHFAFPHFAFLLSPPSHSICERGYVGYVMPAVPRVERDVLLETHLAYLRVKESAREVFWLERLQDYDKPAMQCF